MPLYFSITTAYAGVLYIIVYLISPTTYCTILYPLTYTIIYSICIIIIATSFYCIPYALTFVTDYKCSVSYRYYFISWERPTGFSLPIPSITISYTVPLIWVASFSTICKNYTATYSSSLGFY